LGFPLFLIIVYHIKIHLSIGFVKFLKKIFCFSLVKY
jgi:hypothetical protein